MSRFKKTADVSGESTEVKTELKTPETPNKQNTPTKNSPSIKRDKEEMPRAKAEQESFQ